MTDGRSSNCLECGSQLRLIKGQWWCPLCDGLKLVYKDVWLKHSRNVNTLMNEIEVRWPHQVSLKTLLGATSAKRIDIPPGQKHEPDLEVWILRKHVLSIEVTGSDKVLVPPNVIHILRNKLTVAEKSLRQGIDTLFYTVYPNNTFTLTVHIIKAHQDDIGPGGRLPWEKYIKIPPEEALPREELFRHIQDKVALFYPPI